MNNIFFNAIYKTFLSRILFLLARFVECGTDTGTDIWRYRSFDRWKLHERVLHARLEGEAECFAVRFGGIYQSTH